MSGQATVGSAPAAPPARQTRSWGSRRGRLVGALAAALLAAVVAALVLGLPQWSSTNAKAASRTVRAAWERPAVSAAGLAERSGVTITRVAVTGAGGLVDLRYQVVDPDKAHALHDKRTPPGLVDEQTGVVVNQLLMDHSHTGVFKAGAKYYLVFNNPANWVHHGSKVTVLLGDAQVEHVAVS